MRTDEEIILYAIERLSDGDMLADIAEEVGLKRTTLYMRFNADPKLLDAYTRAREEGLLARGERLHQTTRRKMPKLASGAIDPAAVSQLKLEVETEKWTLAKLHAKVFGDKLALGGADDLPPIKTITDEQLLTRIKALQSKLNGPEPE